MLSKDGIKALQACLRVNEQRSFVLPNMHMALEGLLLRFLLMQLSTSRLNCLTSKKKRKKYGSIVMNRKWQGLPSLRALEMIS